MVKPQQPLKLSVRRIVDELLFESGTEMTREKRASGNSQVNGDSTGKERDDLSPQDSPAVSHQAAKSQGEEIPKSDAKPNDGIDDGNVYEEPNDPSPVTVNDNSGNAAKDDDEPDNVYSGVPSNKPLYNSPPDALYTVEATHKYQGEDEDELSFDAGEIIHVIEFENPEEQDDGWQAGIKQSDGKRGVFPENFTRRVLE